MVIAVSLYFQSLAVLLSSRFLNLISWTDLLAEVFDIEEVGSQCSRDAHVVPEVTSNCHEKGITAKAFHPCSHHIRDRCARQRQVVSTFILHDKLSTGVHSYQTALDVTKGNSLRHNKVLDIQEKYCNSCLPDTSNLTLDPECKGVPEAKQGHVAYYEIWLFIFIDLPLGER